MRVYLNGREPAFQAGYAGSIPATRSNFYNDRASHTATIEQPFKVHQTLNNA